MIFVPHDSVADIPTFKRSKSYDYFAFSHPGLREAFNDWVRQHSGADFRKFLRENRQHVDTVLEAYKTRIPLEHDAYAGTDGQRLASREVCRAIYDQGSRLQSPPRTANDLLAEVLDLCGRFKRHVESGASRRILHKDIRRPRDEEFIHGMFRLLAETFCEDRDIRVSAEVNDGVGPVDFLLSTGASAAVTLEFKLSNNKALVQGYTRQLPSYQEASRTKYAIYCVMDLSGQEKALRKLVETHEAADVVYRPFLVVIDGRDKPSGSKMTEAMTSLPEPLTQPDPSRLAGREATP